METRDDQQRLIRQVRLLQVTSVILLLLVGACFVLIMRMGVATSSPGQESPRSELLLTAPSGELRALLAGTEQGAKLTLYDGAGHASLELSTEGMEPKITLLDEAGRTRLSLYVTSGGGAAQFRGVDGPRLALGESAAGGGLFAFDYQGNRRVELGLVDYEPHRVQPRGLFTLYDQAGKLYHVIEQGP